MSYGDGCFLAFFAGRFLPDVVGTVIPSTTHCRTCIDITRASLERGLKVDQTLKGIFEIIAHRVYKLSFMQIC